jgi:lysophospholipase L1-like esterase
VSAGAVLDHWLGRFAPAGTCRLPALGTMIEGWHIRSRRIFGAIAIVIGCLVGLVLAELALRLAWSGGDNYYVWLPGLEAELHPSADLVRQGASSTVRYRVNSEGVRAAEWSADRAGEYRILAVGGSTTECILLDQDKAWPALLQGLLHETADGRKVWVGNLGRAGDNTRDHVAFMKYALDQYDVDAIVLLIGVNDMGLRLNQGDAYDPDFIEEDANVEGWIHSSFDLVPLSIPRTDLLHRTAIYQYVRLMLHIFRRSNRVERDDKGKWLAHARERRQRAHFLDTLPSLDSALGEYQRNIKTIVDEARRRSIKVTFITQPTIWKANMSPEEERLIWWGLGPGEDILTDKFDEPNIYTPGALERAMALYNERLVKTCDALGVDCVDLAARIPKSTAMFFDDAHFTEAGSLRLAQGLAAYMKSRDPFVRHVANAHVVGSSGR